MATHEDKQMLRDANGDLIPQYWDIQDEEFKPLTGQNGAQDTRLTGSKVEEVYSKENLKITEGSSFRERGLDFTDYKEIFCAVGLSDTKGDCRVTIRSNRESKGSNVITDMIKSESFNFEGSFHYTTGWVDVLSKKVDLAFYNDNDVDMFFGIHVAGR